MSKISIKVVKPSKFTEGNSWCRLEKTAGNTFGMVTRPINMGWAEFEGEPKTDSVVLEGELCDNYTRKMVILKDDKGNVKKREDGGAQYSYKFIELGMENSAWDIEKAKADELHEQMLADAKNAPSTDDEKAKADELAAKAEAKSG